MDVSQAFAVVPAAGHLAHLRGPLALTRGAEVPRADALAGAGVPGHGLSFALGAAGLGLGGAAASRRRQGAQANGGRRQARSFKAVVAASAAPLAARVGEGRGDVRFFLDTADEKEWERLLSLGLFYGVTSNPVIMQRCGQPCTIANITRLASKALAYPGMHLILFQAWGATVDEMVGVGEKIMGVDPKRVGVKLPLTEVGIAAATRLKAKGAIICMTACLSAKQALIANAVGADYISPYLGQMNDRGMEGLEEVTRMIQALKGVPGRTRVFTASIRNAAQVMELACRGADAFTFSPLVADELLRCDATREAAANFQKVALENGATV